MTVCVLMRRISRLPPSSWAMSTASLPAATGSTVSAGSPWTVKNLRTRDIFAFEISKKIGGCDTAAELPLQPRLETAHTGIGVETVVGEQLVFAPGERGIEVSEGLVAALGPKEAGALEGGAVGR
jgi:hypothetical protein